MSREGAETSEHKITGERVGRVAKGATYGWMGSLGIKAYQRKTDEGATEREALVAAGSSALFGPLLVAWFLLWGCVILGKVTYILAAIGPTATMSMPDAIWHFAFGMAAANLYFVAATGVLVHSWSDQCGWQRPKGWAFYRMGSYMGKNFAWVKPWVCWALVWITFIV